MNPVRGGNPPSDKRRRGVAAARAGVFDQDRARVFKVVALEILKTRKTEDVIRKYTRRVRRDKLGENCSTSTIQPRWAIDE